MMKRTTTTTLLLIDVQKDFHPGGSLAIPTANEDSIRIAALIEKYGDKIDRIVATFDSHYKLHIAHPCFWVAGNDNDDDDDDDDCGDDIHDTTTNNRPRHPNPFTIITSKDIEEGRWKPRSNLKLPVDESLIDSAIFYGDGSHESETTTTISTTSSNEFDLTQYCLDYTRRLEAKGRFQLCIWPEHCLIGSSGHGMVDEVFDAIAHWTAQTGNSLQVVYKGQNLLTEMYSALEAEVPISIATSFQQGLFQSLLSCDVLLVAGQAMSHCVNYTVRDIVNHCSQDEISKIVLLTDCSSAVPGFEQAATQFQHEMAQAGVRLVTSTDVVFQ